MPFPSTSYALATSAFDTIPNSISSMLSADSVKACASADSTSAKNPRTATSRSPTNFFASSTVSKLLAGGPVFFNSQVTISSACLPPLNEEYNIQYQICLLKEIYNSHFDRGKSTNQPTSGKTRYKNTTIFIN